MTRIITWPQQWHRATTGSFPLRPKNLVSTSPWTGGVSATPIMQMWRTKLTLPTMAREKWMQMDALFAELGGPSGYLRIADFARIRPQWDYEVVGTPESWSDDTWDTDGTGFESGTLPPFVWTVAAAAQRETSVVIGGLPASQPRVLRRGDHVEFRRNGIYDEVPSLHMVIRDAPTDAFGRTRIEFRPTLRKALAAGDQVVLRYPMGVFRLVNDDQGEIERSGVEFGNVGFELVEALV